MSLLTTVALPEEGAVSVTVALHLNANSIGGGHGGNDNARRQCAYWLAAKSRSIIILKSLNISGLHI